MEGDSPLDDLASVLGDIELPEGFSIISGPTTAQIKPPAVVVQPDHPWIVPSQFCVDEQRYVVLAVVTASTPGDGVRKLYATMKAIKNAVSGAWSWEEVMGPRINEVSGTAFLAAAIRLKYLNTEE